MSQNNLDKEFSLVYVYT